MEASYSLARRIGRGVWFGVWIGLSAGALLAAAAGAARAQIKNPVPDDPIAIATGKVAGTVLDTGVHAYLGLPFAAPPVGGLRWHAPMPVQPWAGVYDASYARPACAQQAGNAPPDAPVERYSEDCLYLNVWTPPNVRAGARLPVMVFIHGGGFTGGSPNIPGYSGAVLASKGVIAVDLAYRLGIFGYLALPELTQESGHHASGDWGSLDQIAGLRWIQRNIAAFGGDPANVTVMGQSAGSESVFQLQASPLAHGLFAKLSGWSGADLAPGGQVPHSLAEGEAVGLEVRQMLHASNLAEMRAMPWRQILAATSQPRGQHGPGRIQTRPIVDGYFLPATPDAIFKAGKQNDVPLYTSSTEEDLGSDMKFYDDVQTVAELHTVARAAFGDAYPEFLKLFPAANDAEARKMALIVSSDTGFGVSNRDWARAAALTGSQPVYLAQWAHVPPPNKPGIPAHPSPFGDGPSHGSDIAYWLGTYVYNHSKAWTDLDKELSAKMQGTLIAFARTGNPNTGAVKVPRYNPNHEERVVFGDTIHIDKLSTAQIEFLRAHAPKRAPWGGPAAPARAAAPGNSSGPAPR